MPYVKPRILIVEDDESFRTTLSQVLTVLGYRATSASDGLAALTEIRREVPDVLLSDLNMPGMSGFELLSVVRRRFPAIRVIAMSGLFSEDQIPHGVTSDAFYQKGSGVPALMKIMGNLPFKKREHTDTLDPIWIQRTSHDTSGGEFVMIACPDCFRVFPQTIGGTAGLILETHCVFCRSFIVYAIVAHHDLVFPQPYRPAPDFETALAGLTYLTPSSNKSGYKE